MSRQQLADVPEKRLLAGNIIKRRELPDCAMVNVPRRGGIRHDGLELRGEQKRIAKVGIVKRLDAHAIARDEEAAAGRIPQREGKHPLELVHALRAEFFVRVDDHFRIGP